MILAMAMESRCYHSGCKEQTPVGSLEVEG